MKYWWAIGVCLLLVFVQASWKENNVFEKKDKLSEYGYFKGPLANLDPVEDVIPYDLNTPLFSNYAEKLRFLKLPPGTTAHYNDTSVFDFPVGTVFIKNFYYPNDFRKPEKGRKILETRLLVHDQQGWIALPYIWNDEQTEAIYDPVGETKKIAYIDKAGKKISTTYLIPNKNQCKGCHVQGQVMVPIGPAARHLNREYVYATGKENQLLHWEKIGLVSGIPDPFHVPKVAVWDNTTSGDINERARAYLDINCGNCHSRQGPASTSGLFLDIAEKDPTHLGLYKSPVAAGRGSGNLQYDIVPGQPHNSILLYRMNTIDPAIAMPEIGREQIHKEGIALIEEWIRKMPAK